jgi:hypothetical protein
MNCWEFKNCPKERKEVCPAYPKKGQICWVVMKTLCKGETQGDLTAKRDNCINCDYLKMKKKELKN